MKKRTSGIGFSLAMRVCLIVTVILVIPLFIHTVIMYVHDYRVKTEEIFLTLNILSEEELGEFETYVDGIVREMRWIDVAVKEGKSGTNAILEKVVQKESYKRVFYLSSEKGVCTASSDKSMIGSFFPRLIENSTKWIRWVDGEVIISSHLESGDIINIGIEGKNILAFLQKRRGFPFPYRTSIVAQNGQIALSDDDELRGKTISTVSIRRKGGNLLKFKKIPHVKYGYSYLINGKKRFAREVAPSGANFSILFDVSTDTALIALHENLGRTLGIFCFAVIVGGILMIWVTIRMARPLKQLCNVMGSVEEGELEKRFVPDRLGFEVNRIGVAFNQMLETVLRKTGEAREQRLKKESLSKEMILGGEFQREVSPTKVAAFSDLEIATHFVSAKEVGGDFYDLYVLDREPDSLLIVVADAAGKGMFAGFFALTLRGILRGLLATEMELSEIVRKANDLFIKDTRESGIFVTAWFGLYDRKEKTLEYHSCGHPPAFMRASGGLLEELSTQGMALGVGDISPIVIEKRAVSEGEILVVYSDGITEAHNYQQELFGERRLRAIIEIEETPGDIAGKVLHEVEGFANGRPQFDDQTIVCIKFS